MRSIKLFYLEKAEELKENDNEQYTNLIKKIQLLLKIQKDCQVVLDYDMIEDKFYCVNIEEEQTEIH